MVTASMDVPLMDLEFAPEKIEDKKDEGLSHHCNLFDKEIVHKIAQVFLPGLASACVDNTTGGFKNPGSVAVSIRIEMIEYLTKRSEAFVAESVILESPKAEVSDHPYDIISDFVDDFASTKRNWFSRVSGWLLSDKREDRIDDFVQEMETSGFWLIDRREAIAQAVLKNVDFKNKFHCDMKFKSENELNEHIVKCSFWPMICRNEGCNAKISAGNWEKHDSVCPFKIMPCEQQCPDTFMRREMDRHCITNCPMKLKNCPFYAVGCQSTVPQCMVHQHFWDDLHSHLLYILQSIHKDTSLKVLKRRVEQLKMSSFNELAEAPDVRSLTTAIKDLQAKLEPLEDLTVSEDNEDENVAEEKKINEEGIINEEVENNKERKINVEVKVNKEAEKKEERKVNAEGKVDKDVENYKEREVNEEGKVDETGKVNEEGISLGKVDGGGKMNIEVKVIDKGKIDEEANINGGKVGKETKRNDEGKVDGGGKINKEGKVIEEGKANEEGKISDVEEADEAGKRINKEGKVIEKGKANEEGKMSDQKEADEAGKKSDQDEADDAVKTSDEEEADETGKMSDQEEANEAGKSSDQEEAEGAGKSSDQEEADTDEAGKLSDQEEADETGKSCDREKVDEAGKTSDQEEANDAGQTNDLEEADEAGKTSGQGEAGSDEAGKTSDEEGADEAGKTNDQE